MAATKKCACMDDMFNNYARDTLEEVLMRSVHNMPVIPAGVEPTPSYPTHYPLDPVVLCPPSEQVFYRVCGSRYSPQAVVLGLMSRFSRVLSPLCMYGWRERDEMCFLRLVLKEGRKIEIFCISPSDVNILGRNDDPLFGLEIFYQRGTSFCRTNGKLFLSTDTMLEVVLALKGIHDDVVKKIIGMVDTDVCIGLLDLELLEGTHPIRKNKNKNKNGNKNGNKFSQKYGDPRCT
jgi:hypothetical protein